MAPSNKKSDVELTEFSAGLTVPTSVQFFMIRFDITGRCQDWKTFVKAAAPQIKDAINEIATECGIDKVFK